MQNQRSLRFQIQPTAPFAFDLALTYLRTSPSSILEVVSEDSYRRAVHLNGKGVLLTVRIASGASARTGPLEVTLSGPSVAADDQKSAEALVRRIFSTEADSSSLLNDVGDDPVFAGLADRYHGLRPVLIPDLFETIVWAIIGQQINVRFAAKCKRALVEFCGDRLAVEGHEYLVFPSPERLLAVPESAFAAIQFSRQKTRYVVNVAQEICAGRLVLDDFWAMPPAAAQARLESLLGIGRWTAEYVLLRGLGHPDVIPAGDGGLRRAIGQAYGLGRSASEEEVRAYAERWAGWRGYAAYYWWLSLQEAAASGRRKGEDTTA